MNFYCTEDVIPKANKLNREAQAGELKCILFETPLHWEVALQQMLSVGKNIDKQGE